MVQHDRGIDLLLPNKPLDEEDTKIHQNGEDKYYQQRPQRYEKEAVVEAEPLSLYAFYRGYFDHIQVDER